jgi:hypothetical protein
MKIVLAMLAAKKKHKKTKQSFQFLAAFDILLIQ